MHVVVLGAGVIGVTTAYYLSERGHRVTLVDRADSVASGATEGNGGQLSYSFTDAMASPALLSKIPRMMTGLDPAFFVRPTLNTQLAYWGQAFLRQCSGHHNRQNTTAILRLALRSATLMDELRSRTALEFSFRQAGKLVLQAEHAAMTEAAKLCTLKREYGCDARIVTFAEAVEIEPALKHLANGYAGAVYSQNDEVGDSHEFTIGLSQWLAQNRETEIKLNTNVQKIVTRGGKLMAVETDQGALQADAVVVCLGAWSNHLLDPLGIKTNIYPMRGYSVTLPVCDTSSSVSITDPGCKIVFSRLGENMRIAGFADFVGYRTGADPARTQKLLETARKIAPGIADYDVSSKREWGGFRPMTPDSRPLTGPSSIEGVHLNTGHGMLGWTLACASAHDVAAGI
ncbi:MAG: FAD-dependent oxidoreductase [Lysobacterales bacterium]